jgi:hypothetical protein
VLERNAAQDLALERLVHDFFGSSRQRLLAYLQRTVSPPETNESSPDELDSVLL